MSFNKTAASPKYSALAAFLVHVLGLKVTVKQRKYLIDHERTLLWFRTVGSGEAEMEDKEVLKVKDVPLYGFTSS